MDAQLHEDIRELFDSLRAELTKLESVKKRLELIPEASQAEPDQGGNRWT
jgi:hypothetical protein